MSTSGQVNDLSLTLGIRFRRRRVYYTNRTYIIGNYGIQNDGCEARQMNPEAGQRCVLPDTWQRSLMVNNQDEIVQLGNYCYSFMRVTSINEKRSHRKKTMISIQNPHMLVIISSP